MKGYLNGNGYIGFVNGRYILFASEAEYEEYMAEEESGRSADQLPKIWKETEGSPYCIVRREDLTYRIKDRDPETGPDTKTKRGNPVCRRETRLKEERRNATASMNCCAS